MGREANPARSAWMDRNNRKSGGRKGQDQGRIPVKFSKPQRLRESIAAEQQKLAWEVKRVLKGNSDLKAFCK